MHGACSTLEGWISPVTEVTRTRMVAVATWLLMLVAGCRVPREPESPSRPPPAPSGGSAPAADGLPEDFVPSSVAFWTAAEGLLAGAAGCPDRCEGVLGRTRDGGRTWQVVHRGAARVWDVATVSGGRAWASASSCAYVGCFRPRYLSPR
ncbi:hypothetical protein caldi_30590 [Caldinitratiruptor microaerophilus]|uniref:Uncharacterized protein n=1 Tax=Caldinitratiruptor microaerophilus TaxID=671077 RepID=A0AA35GB42_9FIRM|nr:hypothetical protein caldi_30590 [Caldinitratiruptor microaerophilus]